MSLKDEILNDINNVFLNLEDFGVIHLIDNKEIVCIVDDDTLKLRAGSNELSVSESTLLLFVKESDLPRKVVGEDLLIDGRIYIVDDWKVNLGVAEVALHQNVSY
jgi:hypothetical protein